MRQHQRRAIHLGDDFGHSEGFARAGDAEQHLMLVASLDARHQLRDGLGLISAGFVIAGEFEVHLSVVPIRIRQLIRRAGAHGMLIAVLVEQPL